MKNNRKKIIAGLVILAVLAVAFWYGGNAPGLRGWKVGKAEEPAETVAEPVEEVQQPEEEQAPAEAPDEPEAPAEESETIPEEQPVEAPEEHPTEEPLVEDPEPVEEPAPEEPSGPAIGPESMDIDPATGKDKYLTDPVPEGKPAPVEPQDVTVTDVAHTCTISIECKTILDHMDWLDPEKV